MAIDPARSQPDPSPTHPPAPPVLAEAAGKAPHPAGRVRAFAYLDTESSHRYRQLMGVLLANKRRFGLRMAPAQLATRLWERFSVRYDTTEALERDLEALCGWGAVDRYQGLNLLDCPHWATLRAPEVAATAKRCRRRARRRYRVSCRRTMPCIFWRLGFRQSSFRHITRVPRRVTPDTWA